MRTDRLINLVLAIALAIGIGALVLLAFVVKS
jgi:hypothetical protein